MSQGHHRDYSRLSLVVVPSTSWYTGIELVHWYSGCYGLGSAMSKSVHWYQVGTLVAVRVYWCVRVHCCGSVQCELVIDASVVVLL